MSDYKNPEMLTRAATIALAVYMVLELAVGLLTLHVYRSSEGFGPALDVLTMISIATLVVLVLCFILVGCWIYRASANAHTLSDEMTISPGWSVGWYFVPIANLFKPYQAMREIWMASHFRGNWHGESTPQSVVAWWALWLITNIIANISLRLSMGESSGDVIGTTVMMDVAVAVLNVPLCLILMSLIRQIAAAQASARYDETFA